MHAYILRQEYIIGFIRNAIFCGIFCENFHITMWVKQFKKIDG